MLAGRRDRNAPLAGKSTLNRLERTPSEVFSASRYHKIGYSPEAIDELLVDIFLEAHRHAAARTAGSTFFSRLLRALLLSAAVRVLRRSSAVRAAAALESGCQRGESGRG